MNAPENPLRAGLHDLADDVVPVDLLDRSLRTSRRIGTRRAVAGAAFTVTLLAGAGAALAALPHNARPDQPAVSPSASPSGPTPSDSDPPSTAPTTPPSSAPPVDPHSIDLRNAVLTLPSFGDDTHCPAGEHRFRQGKAPAGRVGSWDYTFQVSQAPLVYADLDGQPGQEVLATISCNGEGSVSPYLLLAFSPTSSGGLRTLGSVVAAATSRPYDYDQLTVRVDGRTVLVEVTGSHVSDGTLNPSEQLRGYRYDGSTFRQVSGSSNFPAPVLDVHKLDVRNTTLGMTYDMCESGCSGYLVRFQGGTGEQVMDADTSASGTDYRSFTFEISAPVGYTSFPDGDHSAVVTMTRRGGATVHQVATVTPSQNGASAQVLVQTGRDGVEAILGQEARGETVVVTVRTSSGTQVRQFFADRSPSQYVVIG